MVVGTCAYKGSLRSQLELTGRIPWVYLSSKTPGCWCHPTAVVTRVHRGLPEPTASSSTICVGRQHLWRSALRSRALERPAAVLRVTTLMWSAGSRLVGWSRLISLHIRYSQTHFVLRQPLDMEQSRCPPVSLVSNQGVPRLKRPDNTVASSYFFSVHWETSEEAQEETPLSLFPLTTTYATKVRKELGLCSLSPQPAISHVASDPDRPCLCWQLLVWLCQRFLSDATTSFHWTHKIHHY